MTVTTIEEAEFEAKRFLKRIKEFKEAHSQQFNKKSKTPQRDWFFPSKEGGALKRSSMDLTRSLAKLRKY